MKSIAIRNLGQVKEASITFGDLTVLVGPQASGKSIILQWIKLLADTSAVKAQLLDYGADWRDNVLEFFDLYFGEGMQSLWKNGKSEIEWNGKPVDVSNLLKRRKSSSPKETAFLIPAQRVMTLRDGWPRPFGDYRAGDPYAVRAYSERLRVLMENEFGGEQALFPKMNRLKNDYRDLLQNCIFGDFQLSVNRIQSQKRLVLSMGKDKERVKNALPFMVWSAGQREFVPLLLGLYWLMPPSKVSRRDDIQCVIIEELEMGLHPRAISTLLLLVFELLYRGYQVCLSTHSPQILDWVWAWQSLKRTPGASSESLLEILGVKHTQPLKAVAAEVFKREAKVYYFESDIPARDITNLDPDSDQEEEASWGGLLEFGGRSNAVVAKAVANAPFSDFAKSRKMKNNKNEL